MGKLIVLEGTDGSGKSTQFGLLTQGLEAEGMAFRKLVFPQYAEPSSALIRMYLNGEFGQHPGDVNAYGRHSILCRGPVCLLPEGVAEGVRGWRSHSL